jgi:Leucine-rich repeat (LRR) protein
LWKNQIKDISILAKLTNLTKLKLNDNPLPLPQRQKDHLRHALPKCNIEF